MDDHDMALDIVEMIEKGDLDVGLFKIEQAVFARRTALGLGDKFYQDKKDKGENKLMFENGQIVRVIGQLKPNYLYGQEFEIVKVNQKNVKVTVPMEARYRRFSGKIVSIPKNALEVVG